MSAPWGEIIGYVLVLAFAAGSIVFAIGAGIKLARKL